MIQSRKFYKDPALNAAINELDKYRKRQRDIVYYTSKLEEYRNNYSIGAQDYERLRVVGGKSINEVAEVGVRWAELEAHIRKLKADAERDALMIELRLNTLSCLQKEVLELYYIKGMSIDRVASTMHFSEGWVRKTKWAALNSYAKTSEYL